MGHIDACTTKEVILKNNSCSKLWVSLKVIPRLNSGIDKEKGKQNFHKSGQKDQRNFPDNYRDFHAQVQTLLQ